MFCLRTIFIATVALLPNQNHYDNLGQPSSTTLQFVFLRLIHAYTSLMHTT